MHKYGSKMDMIKETLEAIILTTDEDGAYDITKDFEIIEVILYSIIKRQLLYFLFIYAVEMDKHERYNSA